MFNDIIKKPVLKPDSYDEEFSKEYEKWMEEYGKLIKKDFEKLADIQPIEIQPNDFIFPKKEEIYSINMESKNV